MLTRFTPGLPSAASVSITGGTLPARLQSLEQQLASLAAEHNRLLDAVRSAFEDLNREGALDIADAAIVASRGIKFPATQNASTDVNTLDDYEESDNVSSTVTSGTGTLTTASGSLDYTKVGRKVTFVAALTITTNGTGATDIRFTLPFTAADIAGFAGFVTGIAGYGIVGYVNGSSGFCYRADTSGYPGADGAVLRVQGSFFV